MGGKEQSPLTLCEESVSLNKTNLETTLCTETSSTTSSKEEDPEIIAASIMGNENDDAVRKDVNQNTTSSEATTEKELGDSVLKDEQTRAILALNDVIFKQQATIKQYSCDCSKMRKEMKKMSKEIKKLKEELKLAKMELKRRDPVPQKRESKPFVSILLELNDMRKQEKKYLC